MDLMNPPANLNTVDMSMLQGQAILTYKSIVEDLFQLLQNTSQKPLSSPEFIKDIQHVLNDNGVKLSDSELLGFMESLKKAVDLTELDQNQGKTTKSPTQNQNSVQNTVAPHLCQANQSPLNQTKQKKNPQTDPKKPKFINMPYDPKGILISGELHPKLAKKIEKVLIDAQKEGLNVFLFEGYRSIQKQNKLFKSGRGVTNASGGNSFHNYGLAADIVFYDKKGNPSWANHHNWKRLGEIGKQYGLKWGGDFRNIKDLTHFEHHPDMSLRDVKKVFNKQGIKGVWNAIGN